jgi:hypothetical protein
MSKSVGGKIKVSDVEVEGHYEVEYRAPLVIPYCKHYLKSDKKRRGLFGWTEWTMSFHGKKDGSVTVNEVCTPR